MTTNEIEAFTNSDQQVGFEMLLVEISTLFLDLTSDQIDSTIEFAQRRICEILNLDRATLWQFDKGDPGTLLLTHYHQPAGSIDPPDRMTARDTFPWLLQKLENNETVIISNISDYPAEAVVDKKNIRLYGTKSGIYFPLSVGQEPVFGVLTFASTIEEKCWTETVFQGLNFIASVFSNTLARLKSEVELADQMCFEALLIEISARFVNLSAGLIGREIESVLHRINGLLDFDLVSLFQNTKEVPDVFTLTQISNNKEHLHPEEITREQFPWYVQQLSSGHTPSFTSLEDLPAEASHDREICRLFGVKSNISLPLLLGDGSLIGILSINTMRSECVWSEPVRKRLGLVAQIMSNALQRKHMDENIRENIREIKNLKKQCEKENAYLKKDVENLSKHPKILGKSNVVKHMLKQGAQVARTETTVLLTGETGTGKELLARAIHDMSSRKSRAMITINCASLPATLIENELFGREKGAYTGAMTKMVGRFELADKSTLFLDEIGELPLELQSRLLRVLEEGTLERLGSTKTLKVDTRVIAATNRDLEKAVESGTFRQDLYYRLHVFPIVLSPLRDRIEDISVLTRAFVSEFQEKMGTNISRIPEKTIRSLESYSWPGNIRELKNMIERSMIISGDDVLRVELPAKTSSPKGSCSTLDDIIRREILTVLDRTNWRVTGRNGAAEILDLNKSTLYSKMKKLGIQRDVHA